MNVLVLDKTVSDEERIEHRSIFWTLKHLKIRRKDNEFYQHKKDYLGFYPQKNGQHKIKSIHQYSKEDVEKLVDQLDLFYVSDTYGVYEADFREEDRQEFSNKIYGGLNAKELELIKRVIDEEKVLVAEFNTIGAPTPLKQRTEFEELMKIKWSGWISRYFDEMDTLINDELPKWLVRNYKKQHNGEWPFIGSAQVFVSEAGRIEVLEHKKDVRNKVPKIMSTLDSQEKYDIPKETQYPYWFEIIRIDNSYEVISYIDLATTKAGLEKLQAMGLPTYFPASIVRKNGRGKIFYFTGDFSDNPVPMSSSPFYGVPFLYKLLNESSDYSNRTSFYWNYYFPLMKIVLANEEEDQ
ncbi:hypothetical protein GCM10028791_02230 [Echinicola sediminis]